MAKTNRLQKVEVDLSHCLQSISLPVGLLFTWRRRETRVRSLDFVVLSNLKIQLVVPWTCRKIDQFRKPRRLCSRRNPHAMKILQDDRKQTRAHHVIPGVSLYDIDVSRETHTRPNNKQQTEHCCDTKSRTPDTLLLPVCTEQAISIFFSLCDVFLLLLLYLL